MMINPFTYISDKASELRFAVKAVGLENFDDVVKEEVLYKGKKALEMAYDSLEDTMKVRLIKHKIILLKVIFLMGN